jgi:homoserine O-acetyltransferase/O-succinyltransferase
MIGRRTQIMRRFKIILISAIIFFICRPLTASEPPKFADLGDFKLQSGEIIKDFKLAYRTLGRLNARKSNMVLMPTWLMGTTEELVDLGFIGDGKMLDTKKYYVIAIDSIGNGVSTSPSNSRDQADTAFPLFTIKDMVNSEYVLLTKHLKINHIHAVIGISMGGMQAFEWMVSYPGFMDEAVSISGTPWMTSYDMLAWTAGVTVIEAAMKNKAGNDEIIKELTPIQTLLVFTPKFRAENTKPEEFAAFMAGSEKALMKYNAVDWAWQLKAIMTHNILKDFGGSADKAAKAVRARAMIITSSQDNAVYPGPSKAFAVLINAEAPQLTGDCGHFAFLYEQNLLDSLLNGFLGKAPEK